MSGEHRKEMSGAFRRTTNNRMELLAVIVALEALKKPGFEVDIYSDSKYVVDAVGVFLGEEKLQGQEKPRFVEAILDCISPSPCQIPLGQRPRGQSKQRIGGSARRAGLSNRPSRG